MKSARIAHFLWIIAGIFVIACFFSGAWLGRTLSAIPQSAASSGGSRDERADQRRLYVHERESAIATAIASPAAVLILFVTGLVLFGSRYQRYGSIEAAYEPKRGSEEN